MSVFICPNCGLPLERQGRTYVCENRHCFDMAKEGYVHLLPANRKNSQNPGDDKEMVQARFSFLGKGYYDGLCQALAGLAVQYGCHGMTFLDSGCGEGYYTREIYDQLDSHFDNVNLAGIDISKFAVRLAAKHCGGEFAVASAYHLPVGTGSTDLLLNCFSPLCLEEFHRVLKPGGKFFYVVPGRKHLWELKAAVYDQPYENQEKVEEYSGFTYIGQETVSETIHLNCCEDIKNLFGMTPYAWKTPKEAVEKLNKLSSLDVNIDFHIHIYEKAEPNIGQETGA